MALQNSGAISLDDIHVEAGGTSGTSATINDSDIRSMICKSCGATADFGEYYGATSTTYVEGSGGTTNTSGNFKFHIFNSSSNFVINAAATGTASSTVDYIVIAGGGGAAGSSGGIGAGGGGAGRYATGTFTGNSGTNCV